MEELEIVVVASAVTVVILVAVFDVADVEVAGNSKVIYEVTATPYKSQRYIAYTAAAETSDASHDFSIH